MPSNQLSTSAAHRRPNYYVSLKHHYPKRSCINIGTAVRLEPPQKGNMRTPLKESGWCSAIIGDSALKPPVTVQAHGCDADVLTWLGPNISWFEGVIPLKLQTSWVIGLRLQETDMVKAKKRDYRSAWGPGLLMSLNTRF